MGSNQKRGSEKLLAAWRARALTEESIREVAGALEKSPARVDLADVVGGANAIGLRVGLTYEGDDVPQCGNDILFWLRWHITHGGVVRPPKIIINGIPFPDLVRMELDFGHVPEPAPSPEGLSGAVGGRVGG